MASKIGLLFAVALLGLALAVSADWDPTQPAKWVQYPDLSASGVDVNASYQYILADDFECTHTGQILSIHIWGSWLNDYLPFGTDPSAVVFTVSFHADIPADESPTGYSMPGDYLWYRQFGPGEFGVQVWREGLREGWMDPPDTYVWPADSVCWQYNFYLDDGEFYQQGTPDSAVIYWLNVKAEPVDDMAWFGWKTSIDHWNDDGVYGMGAEPYLGPWYELRYPAGHEFYGQSIDLAFVIVGELLPDKDWGDAPEPAGAPGYPTTAAKNGANHIIQGPWLGDDTDAPDPEPDGQPSPAALGDDNDGNDDEDGVMIPVLMQGTTSTITVEINDAAGGGAVLEAWIDFNGDTIWQAGEMIYGGWLPDGVHSFNITTPMGAIVGQTFGRFRRTMRSGSRSSRPSSGCRGPISQI
jgi:hypothetical protein